MSRQLRTVSASEDSLTTRTARPTNGQESDRMAEGSLSAPRFGQDAAAQKKDWIPLELEAPDPAR